MTLTKHFNSKSQISRRERAETETFGGKSLTRYTCTVSMKKARKTVEVVEQTPAVIVHRAFGMRM